MHGYFRPFESGLSTGERMIFNSYYCRICYCFRIAGGQISRYLTTFDAAIYSIIYALGAGLPRPPHFNCERFGKKNLSHFQNDEVGKLFVDASFIAVGEKIRDDRYDGNRMRAWFAEKIFGKQVRQSGRDNPEAAEILRVGFDELNILQNQNRDPMSLFHLYGDISSNMFLSLIKHPIGDGYIRLWKAILKWTFFMDMVCDYEEDLKDGAFNSFKDPSCATFAAYFDKHYTVVFDINRQINEEIMESLKAVHDDSEEWKILYRVITYSLNNVILDKTSGKDPNFKIVKETVNNWKTYLKRLPEKESETES